MKTSVCISTLEALTYQVKVDLMPKIFRLLRQINYSISAKPNNTNVFYLQAVQNLEEELNALHQFDTESVLPLLSTYLNREKAVGLAFQNKLNAWYHPIRFMENAVATLTFQLKAEVQRIPLSKKHPVWQLISLLEGSFVTIRKSWQKALFNEFGKMPQTYSKAA